MNKIQNKVNQCHCCLLYASTLHLYIDERTNKRLVKTTKEIVKKLIDKINKEYIVFIKKNNISIN